MGHESGLAKGATAGRGSPLLVAQHRVDGDGFDLCLSAEHDEFDEDGDADDLAAELFDDVAAGFHGSAGGEDVVADEDALAGTDGVLVHFENALAVFEGVALRDGAEGELAGLADDAEARGEAAGDGGAEDEAAGLGADDEVDVLPAEGVG